MTWVYEYVYVCVYMCVCGCVYICLMSSLQTMLEISRRYPRNILERSNSTAQKAILLIVFHLHKVKKQPHIHPFIYPFICSFMHVHEILLLHWETPL